MAYMLIIQNKHRRQLHIPHISTTFFEKLKIIQQVPIPSSEDRIVYSFNDPDLVLGMNRSGLLVNSAEFFQRGRHLFTQEEEAIEIEKKTDQALMLIRETIPELYVAINQLVECLAFYKSEARINAGGTASSAIGVIWLDPSTNNWSVPFYAEQIVHEFIHTSLFYADLVHGTFTDPARLPEAKVVSSIRRQLRDYDKSFHAAYVSTGLITFHAKAGFFTRAIELATPLGSSVRDLVAVNNEHHVLDPSGEAILQSMVDFLTLARLY